MGAGSMGRVVAKEEAAAVATSTARCDGRETEWDGNNDIHVRRGKEGGLTTILQNGQINVLTKGKDEILHTRWLNMFNLKQTGKIHEGMFRSIIVLLTPTLTQDVLAAISRGMKKLVGRDGGGSESRFNSMRICELHREAHEKGLNVDGSREMLIAALKEAQLDSCRPHSSWGYPGGGVPTWVWADAVGGAIMMPGGLGVVLVCKAAPCFTAIVVRENTFYTKKEVVVG
jgi:hypothetical protein